MKVFISHAHGDEHLAQKVAAAIRDAGLDVFDMYSDVLPGENWAAQSSRALAESDAMVVLLTPESVHSKNVEYEVGYALGKIDYKGRVFPVIAASPGELDPREIPWILKHFQTLELPGRDPDANSLQRLTNVLATAA